VKAEDVWAMPRRELAALLAQGHPIDPGELAGNDYLGVSLGLPEIVVRLTWRHFQKSFRKDGRGRVVGHNVRLVEPPKVFGPFHVTDLPPCGTPFRCRAGVLLDYGAAHPAWHPLARVRDPLVALSPGSNELLLGATYFAAGGARLKTPSFFTLQRRTTTVPVASP
jgi:hypothetical protein